MTFVCFYMSVCLSTHTHICETNIEERQAAIQQEGHVYTEVSHGETERHMIWRENVKQLTALITAVPSYLNTVHF